MAWVAAASVLLGGSMRESCDHDHGCRRAPRCLRCILQVAGSDSPRNERQGVLLGTSGGMLDRSPQVTEPRSQRRRQRRVGHRLGPCPAEAGPVHDNRLARRPRRWDELPLLGTRVRLRPTFDLERPGNAADATRFLSDSQRQVTQTLASLSEPDLDKMVRHTSGGQRSVHRILAGLINEQVHHGAEISLLRDLYRYRSSLTRPNSR